MVGLGVLAVAAAAHDEDKVAPRVCGGGGRGANGGYGEYLNI